jgi:hypothetical protein
MVLPQAVYDDQDDVHLRRSGASRTAYQDRAGHPGARDLQEVPPG